jgi:chemotaxis protein MotB
MGQSSGNIIVAGHTDNIPISTAAFRSNWILSAARAASVVHHLTSAKLMAPERIEIRAHADTIPIASNDNEAGRSLNRRVEIIASFKTEDALAQLGEFHGESSDE